MRRCRDDSACLRLLLLALGVAAGVAAASAQVAGAPVPLVAAPAPDTAVLEDGSVILLTPPAALPTPPPVRDADFVSTRGHQLMLQGKPWYFVGANAYWFIDWASWGRNTGRTRVAEIMLASKRLGLRVLRTWGFNTKLPAGAGLYDETQFLALDFIVYCARVHGIRLILALGNFWHAYKSPEEFVDYAMGSGGHDILDFYREPAVRQLFRSHISTILTRVNRFTGLEYKDDPTIMGYDVMNEPRCPGCESAELQNLVVGWMDEMTRHAKVIAPRQLMALGTEGFFIRDDTTGLHLTNPGPGAECEGEDWPRIAALPAVDFSTLHVYERHMEDQPVPPSGRTYTGAPDWFSCNFECYVQWMARYVQVHLEAAQVMSKNRPMIIEEFGLTWWKKEVKDRKVLLGVTYQMLADSARSGGGLAGVMLWNGAHNYSDDQDGYNIFLDRWPKPLPSPPPALQKLPPIMPYLAQWGALDKDGKNGVVAAIRAPTAAAPAVVPPNPATAKPAAAALPAPTAATAAAALPVRAPVNAIAAAVAPVPTAPKRAAAATAAATLPAAAPTQPPQVSAAGSLADGARRRLRFQSDKLDGFRRGWERGSCAHEASRVWRPPMAFVNGTRPSSDAASWTPEARRWMVAPNIAAWRAYAWPLEEVDLIHWAAQQVA